MKSPSFWKACVCWCRCRLHVGSNRPIHTTFRNTFDHWKWLQSRNSPLSTTGSNMAHAQNYAVGTTLKAHYIYRALSNRIRRMISSHVTVKVGCNHRVHEKGIQIQTASASNTSVTTRRCTDNSTCAAAARNNSEEPALSNAYSGMITALLNLLHVS